MIIVFKFVVIFYFRNPSCRRFPEKERIPRIDPDLTSGLGQCNKVRCESKTSQL